MSLESRLVNIFSELATTSIVSVIVEDKPGGSALHYSTYAIEALEPRTHVHIY